MAKILAHGYKAENWTKQGVFLLELCSECCSA